jgi:hypothetical protein
MKVIGKKEGQIAEQMEKTDSVLFYLYILFGIIAFSMFVTMGYLVYSIFS